MIQETGVIDDAIVLPVHEEKVHATKVAIMDAAERLFAARGFEATSLRAITGEAGVNLASVNYHFSSKDALVLAVLKRRLKPLNDNRLALLDRFQREAGGRPLRVEQILEAIFRPALELLKRPSGAGQCVLRLIGQILAEPGAYLKPLIEEEFAENRRRFHEALHRALPDLSPEEIHWKLHFAMGAFNHTIGHAQVLKLSSEGRCRVGDAGETLERLIAFCAAGFRAPPILEK